MRPDDPVVEEVIRRSMVARIATLSRNGRPHLNPLYFVFVNGCIQLGTSSRTLAAHNVRADPRVAVLFEVEQEWTDPRLLRVHGRATVRTERDVMRSYLVRDIRKYIATVGGMRNMLAHVRQWPAMRAYLTSSDLGVPCVIEVSPQRAEFLEPIRGSNPRDA